MNNANLDLICNELWDRLRVAHLSGEKWQSPDGHKEYYVESVDERRIRIHRDGTKIKDSPQSLTRERTRKALSVIATAGRLSRKNKVVQPYVIGTTLAEFLPTYLNLDGPEIVGTTKLHTLLDSDESSDITPATTIEQSRSAIEEYEIDRTDPKHAAEVMDSLFATDDDCNLILSQLLHSAEVAKSIGSECLSVTLFGNGFRLNVGPVAALSCVDGIVNVFVTGKIPQSLESTAQIDRGTMPLAPHSYHVFGGSISEFRRCQSELIPLHEAYIKAAGRKKNGEPYKSKWPHQHSPGLLEYAYNRVFAVQSKADGLESDSIEQFINGLEPPAPSRIELTTLRIVRDTALAGRIKELHEFRCQLCGESICLLDERRYAEAHHIQPLGSPHDGPDVAENIIVLCPNHHVMCDYGAITLELASIRSHHGHAIGREYIEYHNARIFGRQRSDKPEWTEKGGRLGD